MIRQPRTDFSALVRSIEARGLSRRAIARQLRVDPATVHRWVYDRVEPRYSHGAGLIFLASKQEGEA